MPGTDADHAPGFALLRTSPSGRSLNRPVHLDQGHVMLRSNPAGTAQALGFTRFFDVYDRVVLAPRGQRP